MIITVKPALGNKCWEEDIILGRFATQLYDELARCGYIARLENIPQLGSIKVPSKYKKTRLDYVNLQLYFHSILKTKKADEHFKFTYNSKVNGYNGEKLENSYPTVLDVVQILIFISNIGHFNNTFPASMGIIEACKFDTNIRQRIVGEFKDSQMQAVVDSMIDALNYKQFNMAMAYLVLQNCNTQLCSVKFAQDILIKYLTRSYDDKWKLIFDVFMNVRNMAFYTYDLPVSSMPFTIDISNANDIASIFREIQGKYSNNEPAHLLLKSIAKLLEDSIYYREDRAVVEYETITKSVRRRILAGEFDNSSLIEQLINNDSFCNMSKNSGCSFDKKNILKLTFGKDDIDFEYVFARVSRMNYVRAGKYYRGKGSWTMLIALDKKADVHNAWKVLKYLTGVIYNGRSEKETIDRNIVAVTRFFLYVLYGGKIAEIMPSKSLTAYVAKGCAKRIKPLAKVITRDRTDDADHELCLIHDYLAKDKLNDTAIVIAGSLVINKEGSTADALNEYDGVVLYPNRKSKQMVFLEAKNKKLKSDNGRTALKKKLDNAGFNYDADDIVVVGKDCYYEYTI